MRIKSTFHDYYDGVQATGQDQSLLYLRYPREVPLKGALFPFTRILRHWGSDIVHTCFVVGFCGKIRPILLLQHPSKSGMETALCFTLDEVDTFVTKNFKSKAVERYFSKTRRNYWRELWHYNRHGTFEKFFLESADHRDKYERLFRDNYCPVFVYRESRGGYAIIYNGCLRDVQFYRCVEPYTAFQEIQMFLGGMAFPNKPIPEIPDKIMAEVKGFGKWSFRKEPRDKSKRNGGDR